MAKQSKSDKAKVSRAMREVFTKVPKTVKATGKTGEAKRKMQVAIGLSKARAAGADIPERPSMQRGGVVPATGIYNMHRGERVIPAPKVSAVGGRVGSQQMLPASGAFGTFTGTPPPGTLGGMPTMPTA